MATKNVTYSNLAAFIAVGEKIKAGVPEYKALLQAATIAAFVHLEKHGNYNIIKPLWDAASTFSKGEGRKWLDYLTTFSHLAYNPKSLRGNALADAKFEDLFAKVKGKVMQIDNARKVNWFDHVMTRNDTSKPVDLAKQIATMMKSLSALLEANRLVVMAADKKGIARHASAADVRSELKHQLEAIVSKPLTVIQGGKKNDGATGTRNPSTVEKRKPETAAPVRKAVERKRPVKAA